MNMPAGGLPPFLSQQPLPGLAGDEAYYTPIPKSARASLLHETDSLDAAATFDPLQVAEARHSLSEPPPLPPEGQRALAATDERTLQHFDVLLVESQGALERGLRAATRAPDPKATTRTARLMESFGPIHHLQGEQMLSAYLALAAHGSNGAREVLTRLLDSQRSYGEALLEKQRLVQKSIGEQTRKLSRLESWLSPVMTTSKLIASLATIALFSTTAPMGLAIAGIGAALGASGALVWKKEQIAEEWRQGVSVAVDGALLGAALLGAVGAPLVALYRGTSSLTAVGVGCQYAAEREALLHWKTAGSAARFAFMLVAPLGQYAMDWRALKIRNEEGHLRVLSACADMVERGRQASLDAVTRLVSSRQHSLNQGQQVLSRRHQTTVRIQARMRH